MRGQRAVIGGVIVGILLILLAMEVPDPGRAQAAPVANQKDGLIQCANLIYASSKTSKCFSDEFLREIERISTIRTERRFTQVRLGTAEVYDYPFVIMTGEGSFRLTQKERSNLRSYLTRGGFLLASAGCSSEEWDRSFRAEMADIFPDLLADRQMERIPQDHAVFQTLSEIQSLPLSHGGEGYLEGVSLNGKLVVIYSQEGLNDTAHTTGCCCCGGNEIRNCVKVNMNILAYVLLH